MKARETYLSTSIQLCQKLIEPQDHADVIHGILNDVLRTLHVSTENPQPDDQITTKDYVDLHIKLADSLLSIGTTQALKEALSLLFEAHRMTYDSDVYIFDVDEWIPPIMLRLGLMNYCYDFIRFWSDLRPTLVEQDLWFNLKRRSHWNVDVLDSCYLYPNIGLGYPVATTLLKIKVFNDLRFMQAEGRNWYHPSRRFLVDSKLLSELLSSHYSQPKQ